MNEYKKNTVLLFICFCMINTLNAQYRNNIWIVGADAYQWNFTDTGISSVIYVQPPFIGSKTFSVAHSNIQDSSGLLFSSNGFYIYNKEGNMMDSEPIVPSKFVNYRNNRSDEVQQTIILPKKDNRFYVFATGVSDHSFDISNPVGSCVHDILNYAIVDMNENGGLGKVVSKFNYLIEDDSLSLCQMSAVRHANGRDWWLVKPHYVRHLFNIFLVTPDSVIKQPNQEFASPVFTNGVNGQSNFSIDGSLYAMSSTFSTIYTQVNYFDRCTGTMTKFKSIPRIYDSFFQDYLKISGVCFSPNNRFLYLINNVSITQYDLETDERVELITDSMYNPAGNTVAYNAPDGRIYIGNYNEVQNKMSYIEFPDKKGKDAGLCQLCFTTPNQAAKAPPNMPNYELGPLEGSPCDTIKPTIPIHTAIKIYPNPVINNLTIELPTNTQKARVAICNMLGEVVITEINDHIISSIISIPVEHLSRALYGIRIVADEKIFIGKFIKE